MAGFILWTQRGAIRLWIRTRGWRCFLRRCLIYWLLLWFELINIMLKLCLKVTCLFFMFKSDGYPMSRFWCTFLLSFSSSPLRIFPSWTMSWSSCLQVRKQTNRKLSLSIVGAGWVWSVSASSPTRDPWTTCEPCGPCCCCCNLHWVNIFGWLTKWECDQTLRASEFRMQFNWVELLEWDKHKHTIGLS